MPSDFQFKEPPLALRIPKGRPWYGMDIFWNHPLSYKVLAHPFEMYNSAQGVQMKPYFKKNTNGPKHTLPTLPHAPRPKKTCIFFLQNYPELLKNVKIKSFQPS